MFSSSDNLTERNFALSELLATKGRKLLMLNITRDDSALLAIGFAGEDADHST